jgi:hypothetical protein
MLCYAMLCYAMLFYSMLCYAMLCRAVPCRAVPYRTVPYRTVPYRTVPYRTILYYTILYYTILYYTILYYTILYYTILLLSVFTNHRINQNAAANFKHPYESNYNVLSQQILHFTHPTRAWVSSNQDVQRLQLYQGAMCFLFGKVKLSVHTSQNIPFLTPQDIYSQVWKVYLRSAKDMTRVVTTYLWRHTSFQMKSATSFDRWWKNGRTTNNTNLVSRQIFIKINIFNEIPPFGLVES